MTMKVVAPRITTLIGIRGHSGGEGVGRRDRRGAGATKGGNGDNGGSGRYATNITLRGLTFAFTADTYLEPYVVPSPGDWSISRNGALFVSGAEHVTVESCAFVRVGGNAVFLSGHAFATRITNNEFHLIGDSAIATVGDIKGNDGITTDAYPLDTVITGNHIHEVGVNVTVNGRGRECGE